MINFGIIIALVWIHFVADFVLQSNYVATNKSSSNKVLAYHVALYALPFCVFGVTYALINMVLHFMTDWVTSRCTSYLHQKGERHWFFVVIGLDQAIHLTCLVGTYLWLQ